MVMHMCESCEVLEDRISSLTKEVEELRAKAYAAGIAAGEERLRVNELKAFLEKHMAIMETAVALEKKQSDKLLEITEKNKRLVEVIKNCLSDEEMANLEDSGALRPVTKEKAEQSLRDVGDGS